MKKIISFSLKSLLVGSILLVQQVASAHIPTKLESKKHSKVVLECFLQEGKAELLMQSSNGTWATLATANIFSGDFSGGQKYSEGDMRTPWGVYPLGHVITYKDAPAVIVGYPTKEQESLGATGSDILVHTGRSSRGCISTQDDNFLRLLTQTVFLAGNAEIHIFPAHMSGKNMMYLKYLFPEENVDSLQVTYEIFKGIRTLKEESASVTIAYFASNFSKNYYYANDAEYSGDLLHQNTQKFLRDFLSPDTLMNTSFWDSQMGTTRNAMMSYYFNQENVLFDSMTVSKNNAEIASIKKTRDGFVGTSQTCLEGLVFKRQLESLAKVKVESSFVLHSIDEKKHLNPVDFEEPKFFKGVIIKEDQSKALLITYENKLFVRAAGEQGLFVPVTRNQFF